MRCACFDTIAAWSRLVVVIVVMMMDFDNLSHRERDTNTVVAKETLWMTWQTCQMLVLLDIYKSFMLVGRLGYSTVPTSRLKQLCLSSCRVSFDIAFSSKHLGTTVSCYYILGGCHRHWNCEFERIATSVFSKLKWSR